MTEDNPLAYTTNTKAFTLVEAGACVVLTIGLVIAKLTGWLAISWSLVATPILFVGAMMYLYGFLRNAIHEAIRLADADAYLDEQNIALIKNRADRTLTPMRVADALDIAGGEQA
jgi:hypothetical protein